MKIKKLPQLSDEANELLEEAKQKNFQTVVIIGFKNGQIHTKGSRSLSWNEFIGALELAKLDIWNKGMPDEEPND